MRIEWFMFQPFESRVGIDEVVAVRLRNTNRWGDIRLFTQFLAVMKAKHQALGHLSQETNNRNAGGWLGSWHRWFVEPCVWEELVAFYTSLGVAVEEVEPVPIEQLKWEGIKYYRAGDKRRYGTPEPTREQILAS